MEQKKRGKSKEIALELLKILQEHTDRQHLLTKDQLIALHYGTYRSADEQAIEPKTFYAKIDELRSAGFPVIRTKGKWTKYYLDDARFSKDELLFLVCMIQSSPDLAEEEAERLKNKLLAMRVHKRAKKEVEKAALSVEECHNPSPEQIRKFSELLEAAHRGGRVSCKYILSRENGYVFSETRTVSPRAIEFTREGARVTLLDGGMTKYVPLADIVNVCPEEKNS